MVQQFRFVVPLLTLALLTQNWCAAQDPPPNVIFVMVDDLGWNHLGCYGSQVIATPNLDRMASQGMRFLQAYSGSVVCAPARCVLMTGKHTGHCSVRVNSGGVPLLDDDVTVAEVLREQGFNCGGFGKWALGDLDTSGAPENQGFQQFFGFYHQFHAHLTYPTYLIDTGTKIPLPQNRGFNAPFDGNRVPAAFTPTINPHTQEALTYAHYEVFDRTLKFIKDNKDERFFCYAAWTPPHGRLHIPADDPAAQQYLDRPWSMESKVTAAMVSMLDRQLGELFELLKQLKIDERTIVFFCSDHGAATRGEGEIDSSGLLRGQKRSMYEGGLRIPMIVRWPGKISAASTSDQMVYLGDVMATLAEVAGGQDTLPGDVDSISFLPTLLDQPEEQADHAFLFWEWSRYNWRNQRYGPTMTAIRQGDWKLLRHDQREPWELYDLRVDPSETDNLVQSHAQIADQLKDLANQSSLKPRQQLEPSKPQGSLFR